MYDACSFLPWLWTFAKKNYGEKCAKRYPGNTAPYGYEFRKIEKGPLHISNSWENPTIIVVEETSSLLFWGRTDDCPPRGQHPNFVRLFLQCYVGEDIIPGPKPYFSALRFTYQGVLFYFLHRFRRQEGGPSQYVAGEHKEEKKWITILPFLVIACDVGLIVGTILVWI